MINHLDLCSGIGGFALGFNWAKLSKTIAFCDTEKFCHKVLSKNFPNVPIFNDVKELANEPRKFIQRPIGVLTSGYPCQPFSTSGKRKGEEDPRHIFPYIHEIVKQVRPSYCVYENVYGHVSMGLDEVLLRMEDINYHTRAFVISAASVGARHRRNRVFIICKNMGNSYYDGLTSTEVRGCDQENATRSQKRTKTPKQFEGASTSKNNVNVSNTESERTRSNDQRLWQRSSRIDRGQRTDRPQNNETLGNTSSNRWDENKSDQTSKSVIRQSEERGMFKFEGASDVSNTDNQGLWSRINGADNEVQKASRERRNDGERGSSYDERSNIATTKDGRVEVSNSDTWSSETLVQWQQSILRETIERWETDRPHNEDVSERGRCEAQLRLDGVANGISYWMDEPRGVPRTIVDQKDRVNRLKGLGNAIVPHHAYHIGLAIKEDIKNDYNSTIKKSS